MTMTIDPITLAEALAMTIPATVRDSIPAVFTPTPEVWAAWARDIVQRYHDLEAGPTVGDQRVRAAGEALAQEGADDARRSALERLRLAGVDVSRPEWNAASTETLLTHAAAHEGAIADKPHCCHVGEDDRRCPTPPTHGIYPDDGGDPYRGSHACTPHVGDLLYEGRNVVTPIEAELAR